MAREPTWPQFGLLLILVLLPLQTLSGGSTPCESMPELVQNVMLAAPTTHFVMLAQGILFRGAGLDIVWPQLVDRRGVAAGVVRPILQMGIAACGSFFRTTPPPLDEHIVLPEKKGAYAVRCSEQARGQHEGCCDGETADAVEA